MVKEYHLALLLLLACEVPTPHSETLLRGMRFLDHATRLQAGRRLDVGNDPFLTNTNVPHELPTVITPLVLPEGGHAEDPVTAPGRPLERHVLQNKGSGSVFPTIVTKDSGMADDHGLPCKNTVNHLEGGITSSRTECGEGGEKTVVETIDSPHLTKHIVSGPTEGQTPGRYKKVEEEANENDNPVDLEYETSLCDQYAGKGDQGYKCKERIKEVGIIPTDTKAKPTEIVVTRESAPTQPPSKPDPSNPLGYKKVEEYNLKTPEDRDMVERVTSDGKTMITAMDSAGKITTRMSDQGPKGNSLSDPPQVALKGQLPEATVSTQLMRNDGRPVADIVKKTDMAGQTSEVKHVYSGANP